MGEARRATGTPFPYTPPFLSPQKLSSPAKGAECVQPGEHSWRHCKSAVNTSLGVLETLSWTPTHAAGRSPSTEPLAESHTLLRDISCQLSRQLLHLHPQADSSLHSALTKEASQNLAGRLALSWTRAVRVVLGTGQIWPGLCSPAELLRSWRRRQAAEKVLEGHLHLFPPRWSHRRGARVGGECQEGLC